MHVATDLLGLLVGVRGPWWCPVRRFVEVLLQTGLEVLQGIASPWGWSLERLIVLVTRYPWRREVIPAFIFPAGHLTL
jgi:hypothetical protein